MKIKVLRPASLTKSMTSILTIESGQKWIGILQLLLKWKELNQR